jgi:hypothetical protein
MSKIKSSRIRRNIGAVLLGQCLLERLSDRLGVDCPLSLEQAADAVVRVVLEDTLDSGSSETKSAADYTLEAIDNMLATKYARNTYFEPYDPSRQIPGVRFLLFDGDAKEAHHAETDKFVGIDIAQIYADYQQYYHHHRLDNELLSRRDFVKNLTKLTYYVKQTSIRFDTCVKRAVKMNLTLAKERGLDLPFLYHYVGLGGEADE